MALIKDGESLIGAKYKYGSDIPVYDDGFGPLWIARDSMGIVGIVRAQSFETAYEIVEDEFMPTADMSHSQFVKEYGENYSDDPIWQENYGFRPNGSNGPKDEGIYQRDLNGDYLNKLTQATLDDLEITLEIETDE